jgi:hypothetical protein
LMASARVCSNWLSSDMPPTRSSHLPSASPQLVSSLSPTCGHPGWLYSRTGIVLEVGEIAVTVEGVGTLSLMAPLIRPSSEPLRYCWRALGVRLSSGPGCRILLVVAAIGLVFGASLPLRFQLRLILPSFLSLLSVCRHGG